MSRPIPAHRLGRPDRGTGDPAAVDGGRPLATDRGLRGTARGHRRRATRLDQSWVASSVSPATLVLDDELVTSRERTRPLTARKEVASMSAILLDDVRPFIRRFVVLDDAQADAVTFWVAHTHVFDAFDCTPYLALTLGREAVREEPSVRGVGAARPLPAPTANMSDAALFRVIDEASRRS